MYKNKNLKVRNALMFLVRVKLTGAKKGIFAVVI